MSRTSLVGAVVFGAATAGCAVAPSVEILGSFFPAWLACLVAALVLTALSRVLLLRAGIEEDVGPLVLFYPCLLLFLTCIGWLIIF